MSARAAASVAGWLSTPMTCPAGADHPGDLDAHGGRAAADIGHGCPGYDPGRGQLGGFCGDRVPGHHLVPAGFSVTDRQRVCRHC